MATTPVGAAAQAPNRVTAFYDDGAGHAFRTPPAAGPNVDAPATADSFVPPFTYHGGTLLQNQKIAAVFWGTNVWSPVTQNIGNFYSELMKSQYMTMLSEYNANGMSLGYGGSFQGAYTITPGQNQIGPELAAQIKAGKLPGTGAAQTFYVVHMPVGSSVTAGGETSCQAKPAKSFCAYHKTYFDSDLGGINYAVIPDFSPGSGCDQVCGEGDNVSPFNSLTMAASHEIFEAITDVQGAPTSNGWYDQANHEIGDICNAQPAVILGGGGRRWTVQMQWSNRYNQCIAGVTQPTGPTHIEPAWTTDYSLTGYPTGPGRTPQNVVVMPSGDGRLQLVSRDTSGQGWFAFQPAFGGGFQSGYSLFGGPVLPFGTLGPSGMQSPPTMALADLSWAGDSNVLDRSLHVFARGGDGAMYERTQTGVFSPWSGSPTGWNFMGSPAVQASYVTGRPASSVTLVTQAAVGQDPNGRIELFATGSDGAVYTNAQPLSSLPWAGWVFFGPSNTPKAFRDTDGTWAVPSVATTGDGRMYVFLIGSDRQLWYRFQQVAQNDGTWSDWKSLGGTCTTDAAVGVNVDGRLEVFLRNPQFALCHQWQTNNGAGNDVWSGWNCNIAGIGGYIVSKPVVANNADGTLNVFVVGSQNRLFHLAQSLTPTCTPGNNAGCLDYNTSLAATAWGPWTTLGNDTVNVFGGNKDLLSVGRHEDGGRLELFYPAYNGIRAFTQ